MTEAIRLVVTGDSKGGVKALGEVANAADKTQGVFGKYGAGLNKASNYAAVGVAALTGVIVKSVVTLEKQGAGIAALKREIDITTEGASILSGEFQRYGIEATTGGVGIKKLAQSIDEARNGSKTAAAVFERLGISVDQLKSMSDTEAILATRDALAEMGSGADRTNMAVKLLGRGALGMSAWYSTSAKDMAQTNKTLKDSGMVWSDEDLADYKKAVQAQREMQIALTGIQITIARDVVPAMTPMVRLFGQLLRFVRPISPVLVPATVALAGFVGVVKGAMVIQSTAGAVRGFYAAFKAGKLATAVGSLRNFSGLARNLPGLLAKGVTSFGLYGLAIAGVTADIYLLVKAWNAYNDLQASDKQLVKATQDSTKADARAQAKIDAWKDAHPGQALPAGLQKLQDAVNQGASVHLESKAQHVADKYWWQQFASGGDFITRGATPFIAGEGSEPERVTVTPLSKMGRGSGVVHHHHYAIEVKASFLAMPTHSQVRQLTDMISRELGPQVDRLQRGRFASA